MHVRVVGVGASSSPVSSEMCGVQLSSSPTPQAQVLALLLRLEAVFVAAAAAVPEADTFALRGVEEPHHGVVLAAALVLAEQTGLCTDRVRGRLDRTQTSVVFDQTTCPQLL